MSDRESRTARICVVQLALQVGEVEANLRRVADVVGSAVREHGPDIVVLPDGIGSPIAYHPGMAAVARPVDGMPYEVLVRLARKHGCWVGGGFLAVRSRQARSTYVLADPIGGTHLHDKDQPDFWEACYATGGADDGFTATPLGPIGVVGGMEWLRTRTAERLAGYVDLLLGGACAWWYSGAPGRRGAADGGVAVEGSAAIRQAPARMARVVGAPAAFACQVGRVPAGTPLVRAVPLVGDSQIVDADGHVLVRLSGGDGEGHVAADVQLGSAPPVLSLPASFWLSRPPLSMRLAWLAHGLHGRIAYARRHRAGEFPWQQLGSVATLCRYNPPDVAAEERPEHEIVAHPHGPEPLPPEDS